MHKGLPLREKYLFKIQLTLFCDKATHRVVAAVAQTVMRPVIFNCFFFSLFCILDWRLFALREGKFLYGPCSGLGALAEMSQSFWESLSSRNRSEHQLAACIDGRMDVSSLCAQGIFKITFLHKLNDTFAIRWHIILKGCQEHHQ